MFRTSGMVKTNRACAANDLQAAKNFFPTGADARGCPAPSGRPHRLFGLGKRQGVVLLATVRSVASVFVEGV
jgi:hypothetical protein